KADSCKSSRVAVGFVLIAAFWESKPEPYRGKRSVSLSDTLVLVLVNLVSFIFHVHHPFTERVNNRRGAYMLSRFNVLGHSTCNQGFNIAITVRHKFRLHCAKVQNMTLFPLPNRRRFGVGWKE